MTFENVSRETKTKIDQYHTLLKQWNPVHNLIQKDDLVDDVFWERHIADSLSLSQYLDKTKETIDFGSGNGLPGIILSILDQPMTLNEIDKKKISFLKLCRSSLSLNYKIIEDRAETITQFFPQTTARAFASLEQLISLQKNVSRETKAVGYYLKGEKINAEIEKAQQMHTFSYNIYEKKGGVIVKVEL